MTKRSLFILFILLGLAQISFAQKAVPPAKKKLVAQLITNTSEIFPSEAFQDIFQQLNNDQSTELTKELTASLNSKIDADANLSAQTKAEAKAKVPELVGKISHLTKTLLAKNFEITTWVNQSFNKHYSTKFTVSELQKLNAYFKSSNGKETVKLFNKMIVGGIKNKDQDVEPSDAEAEQMGNFLKAPHGNKFFNVLMDGVFKDVSDKTDVWSKQALNNLKQQMTAGEMKRLIDEFLKTYIVAD